MYNTIFYTYSFFNVSEPECCFCSEHVCFHTLNFLFQSLFALIGWLATVMAGPELLLDSSIRMWVVLPIVFITFFVGILRHYVTQLLHSDKKVDLEQVSDRWDHRDVYSPHIWTDADTPVSHAGSASLQSGAPAQPHPSREWEVHPPTGRPRPAVDDQWASGVSATSTLSSY